MSTAYAQSAFTPNNASQTTIEILDKEQIVILQRTASVMFRHMAIVSYNAIPYRDLARHYPYNNDMTSV